MDAMDQMSPITPWYTPRFTQWDEVFTRSTRTISVNARIASEPNPSTATPATNKCSCVSDPPLRT